MELFLIAALNGYPRIFANEYCWLRAYNHTHEEAVEIATERGETTDDSFVEEYCAIVWQPIDNGQKKTD